MKCIFHFVLASGVFFSTCLFPSISFAKGAIVEAMQMPAWVERAGKKLPLKPGMELNPGDVLTTGAGARMLLRLDEGSLVKMGETASLDLTSLQPAENERGSFEAAINVIKGAFRFSTTTLGLNRKRIVDVRIGTVTVGIRGTDIWGSSSPDKDILCLIEGKVSAQREGEAAFAMQDPLSFYIAPKNKPALPVKPVPEAQLSKWAAETEVLPNGGVLSAEGGWAVNLMSLDNLQAAETAITLLAAAGYAAEIHLFSLQGKEWYRIRITGFSTKPDANTFAGQIDGQFGINKPWVVQF